MAVIEIPDYSGSMTVSVDNSTVSVSTYGSTESASLAAILRRTTVLTDPSGPDSVEVVSQPAEGQVIARSDNRLTVDLEDVNSTAPLTFTYRKTNGAQTTDVDVTINPTDDGKETGWEDGAYYRQETDGSNAVVAYPAEDSRPIYLSELNAITDADMVARDPNLSDASGITNQYLRNSQAYDAGQNALPYRWGEAEDVALTHARALQLWNDTLGNNDFYSPWWLAERGGTYPSAPPVDDYRGESQTHPLYIGAWGTGADPHYLTNGPSPDNGHSANMLFQSFSFDRLMHCENASFICADGFVATGADIQEGSPYQSKSEGQGFIPRGVTFRRYVILDAFRPVPNGGALFWADWDDNRDRISASYFSKTRGGLIEYFFLDQIGWERVRPYRANRDGNDGKSAETRSQGLYIQFDNSDMTIRNGIVNSASHAGLQQRCGGICTGLFVSFANFGIVVGNQPEELQVEAGVSRSLGGYNYCTDLIVTEPGMKDVWGGPTGPSGANTTLAGGIEMAGTNYTLRRTVLINGENGTPMTSEFQLFPFGAVQQASETSPVVVNKNNGTPHTTPEYVLYNWMSEYNADVNTNGLDQVALTNATLQEFIQQRFSITNGTFADFGDQLRLLSEPWEELDGLKAHFLDPAGFGRTARTVAQTVRFLPPPDGSTPGLRSDIDENWNTGDLPGSVAGDSIDLEGHGPFWNITPPNSVNNLAFGGPSRLTMLGGALRPQGTIFVDPAGNEVVIKQGSRFAIAGYAGTQPLTITANDGSFFNNGDCSGEVDLTAVGPSEMVLATGGGSFTLKSGRTLTIGGLAKVGFDGTGGGTAAITLETGSTIRFRPGARLQANGLRDHSVFNAGNNTSFSAPVFPALDSVITGDQGSSARVIEAYGVDNQNARYVLDEMVGDFPNGEIWSTTEPTVCLSYPNTTAVLGTTVGTTTSFGDPSFGQLREFRSGANGFADTDVVSSIALGGTLEVDLRANLGALTHTLIAADTVTGGFEAVQVPGLGSRDATIEVTGTQVNLTVAATGTGQVSVV
ncbi:MAG: hypothetical protein AAFQ38_16415 [Pseudomonadota bacterium]